MTDNIIPFSKPDPTPKEPDELVLVCPCGCMTFLVISSGALDCSMCGERMEDDVTGYNPDTVREVEAPKEPQRNHQTESEDFALAHTKRQIDPDKTVALVVMNADGVTSTWSLGSDTKEKEDWLKSRIDNLWDQLK